MTHGSLPGSGGAIKAGSAQARVRKGLVVLQFAISIILIIGTIIVADQMRLIREKDLGFNKEEVVVASIFRQDRYLSDGGQLQKQYLKVRDAFSQHPNISTVSATSDLPGHSWPNREQNSAQKKLAYAKQWARPSGTS